MTALLVVEPVFAERVWGGTELKRWYGAAVPTGIIGECWAISGLASMSGLILQGAPAGSTLADAWANGLVTGQAESGEFPLLCKLLDPQDWLSVQVHPNDEQAQSLEGMPRGKAECWLVVAARADAELILGHRGTSSGQLRQALADGALMELLITRPAAQDDFFMVSAGEVHSLGPGMMVYEVQQASDITYRLFDFDRTGLDGQPRPLHIEKGFSVVSAPHDPTAPTTAGEWIPTGAHARWRVLVDCPQFRVERWETQGGHFTIDVTDFRALTVVGGSGTMRCGDDRVDFGLGTSVVVPRGAGPLEVSGDLVLVASTPGPELH
jgi:mannose-6-phosphate isomerase